MENIFMLNTNLEPNQKETAQDPWARSRVPPVLSLTFSSLSLSLPLSLSLCLSVLSLLWPLCSSGHLSHDESPRQSRTVAERRQSEMRDWAPLGVLGFSPVEPHMGGGPEVFFPQRPEFYLASTEVGSKVNVLLSRFLLVRMFLIRLAKSFVVIGGSITFGVRALLRMFFQSIAFR